jgi:hypothetical protein
VDVVQRWSEAIARRTAPEEADFAAEVGMAYAAGGAARKELRPRPSVQPGAFGPGAFAADLPLILRALADTGNILLALLRSPYFGNAMAAGGLLAALRPAHHDGPRTATGPPAAQRPAEQEPGQPLPPSERQALELAFESLRDRLASAGFDPTRAGHLAHELLEELATDTTDAALFVAALTAVPDSAARSRQPVAAHGGRHRRGR